MENVLLSLQAQTPFPGHTLSSSSHQFLTLYAPTLSYQFSSLFSIDFIDYLLGEPVFTSRQFMFGDHLPNSHDLYVL